MRSNNNNKAGNFFSSSSFQHSSYFRSLSRKSRFTSRARSTSDLKKKSLCTCEKIENVVQNLTPALGVPFPGRRPSTSSYSPSPSSPLEIFVQKCRQPWKTAKRKKGILFHLCAAALFFSLLFQYFSSLLSSGMVRRGRRRLEPEEEDGGGDGGCRDIGGWGRRVPGPK